MTRRPSRDELRAAGWALRAAWSCRRQVRTGRVDDVDLPSSAAIPAEAGRAVRAVLRRLRVRCLTRALVLQAWRSDHGDPVDVLIGVTAPATGFSAHAWLDEPDGDAANGAQGHEPIHRLPPRPRRQRAGG